MRRRWPKAKYVEDSPRTAPTRARIFDTALWRPDRPLRVVLIGTDFEVRVWETLLAFRWASAHDLFRHRRARSARRRPRARSAPRSARTRSRFVVPCHRVLGKIGEITGYHWGLTRKRAMLGWEAGMAGGVNYAARSSFDSTVESASSR